MIDLKKFRMDLHKIPELGFEEVKTKSYILDAVSQLDCTVQTVDTGVVLYFDNKASRTIAFRADMDALQIQEETGLDFASTHLGKMHACGHDGHMAILLGLAHWLSDNGKALNKNVVLVFQPSEERNAGANSIIDSGILQKLDVEAIFGLHLWPGKEKNSIWTRRNELMSISSEVNVEIEGCSAHVADSELGVDSLYVASKFLTEAYEVEAELPDDVSRLLKFGKMHSGSVRNVLPDHAEICGTLRSYDPEVHQYFQDEMQRIADHYDDEYGTTTTIAYHHGYKAVINDSDLFTKVRGLIPEIRELERPVLQAEDFGLYRKICPILFFFLGVGDTAPLHNEKFDFDMDVLDVGLGLFVDIVKKF